MTPEALSERVRKLRYVLSNIARGGGKDEEGHFWPTKAAIMAQAAIKQDDADAGDGR